jgi:hypothetical protein
MMILEYEYRDVSKKSQAHYTIPNPNLACSRLGQLHIRTTGTYDTNSKSATSTEFPSTY